jgi:hypothetical protein
MIDPLHSFAFCIYENAEDPQACPLRYRLRDTPLREVLHLCCMAIAILCGIVAFTDAIACHSTLMVRRLSTNRVHIVRRNSPTLATIIVVRTLS